MRVFLFLKMKSYGTVKHSLMLQSSMALYFVIGGASLLVGGGIAFFLVTPWSRKKNKMLTRGGAGS
jgi:hypothetical protein